MMEFLRNIDAKKIADEQLVNLFLFEHCDAKYLGEQILAGDFNLDCLLKQEDSVITEDQLLQSNVESIMAINHASKIDSWTVKR